MVYTCISLYTAAPRATCCCCRCRRCSVHGVLIDVATAATCVTMAATCYVSTAYDVIPFSSYCTSPKIAALPAPHFFPFSYWDAPSEGRRWYDLRKPLHSWWHCVKKWPLSSQTRWSTMIEASGRCERRAVAVVPVCAAVWAVCRSTEEWASCWGVLL